MNDEQMSQTVALMRRAGDKDNKYNLTVINLHLKIILWHTGFKSRLKPVKIKHHNNIHQKFTKRKSVP